MAVERLAPDAILTQTNLVGTLADIQNDPDTPDTTWLTATDTSIATVLRVSFPTPSNTITGSQEFRARVRRVGGTDNPPVNLELWINGASTLVGPNVTVVNSTDGELISWTWDAGTHDATAVECRVNSPSTGGKPATRATCEIEAIEWNATIQDAGPPGAISNLAGVSGGATSAILSWTKPTTGSTASYRIFRDTVLVGTTTDVKYRDTGLVAGTAYSYTVQPFNDLGDGPVSAAVSVTPVEFSMNDSLEGAEGVVADSTNTTASTGLTSAGSPTFRAIAAAPETTATGVLFPAYSATTTATTTLDWTANGKLSEHRGKFYFRIYARFTGFPPSDTVGRFIQFGTEAGFNAIAMGVWLSSTGNLYLSNTTDNTNSGSIGVINTNEWVRIETSVDLFSKEIVLRAFRASTNNLHGNTPDAEVIATSASTASIVNSQRVGWAFNATPWPDVHIDELKWSNRGWVGSAKPPPSSAFAAFGIPL